MVCGACGGNHPNCDLLSFMGGKVSLPDQIETEPVLPFAIAPAPSELDSLIRAGALIGDLSPDADLAQWNTNLG